MWRRRRGRVLEGWNELLVVFGVDRACIERGVGGCILVNIWFMTNGNWI